MDTDRPPVVAPVPGRSWSRAGLVALFFWLLWGDFCFTLMEAVVPAIMPLKLQELHAPNWIMSLIMTTLPGVLNMTLCPWISFASDRHRGRWGRRIPFILGTLPMLCGSLVLMGWSESIGPWLQGQFRPLAEMAPSTVIIALIGVFMVLFQFFNMFVCSVIWGLYNDVVPEQHLGRFMALFRIVGMVAGALFQAFIFKYATSHTAMICTGGAVLYAIGIGVMCVMVKEPPLPAEPPAPAERRGFLAGVRSFGRESFSHRLYWYSYISHAFRVFACGCGIFTVFFQQEMGLDLEQIGWLAATGMVSTIVATMLSAVYVDRWHPLRILTYSLVVSAVAGSAGWIWLLVSLPGHLYFWMTLGMTVITAFSAALGSTSDYTVLMRIYPRARYVQFCSARAMLVSVAGIISGLVAGFFLDGLRLIWPEGGFSYRWIFIWSWVFTIVAAGLTCRWYREWKRLGGDAGYRAPTPWIEARSTVSEDPPPPTTVPTPGHSTLSWALRAFTTMSLASVITWPLVGIAAWQLGLTSLAGWCWWGFLPAQLVLLVVWWCQSGMLARAMATTGPGSNTRPGLPHPGLLLVLSLQQVAILVVGWLQVRWTFAPAMERESILFGTALIGNTLVFMIIVHWLCRLERPVVPGDAARREVPG